MNSIYQVHETKDRMYHKNVLQNPTEKKSIMNPNNDSPNIFKNNLKMRLMNYQLIYDLEKNPLNLNM